MGIVNLSHSDLICNTILILLPDSIPSIPQTTLPLLNYCVYRYSYHISHKKSCSTVICKMNLLFTKRNLCNVLPWKHVLVCTYICFKCTMKEKSVCFQKEHWSIMYVRSMKFSHYAHCQCSMLHAVSILFPSMLLESIEVKTSWKESSVFAPLVSITFKSDAQTQLFKICERSAK